MKVESEAYAKLCTSHGVPYSEIVGSAFSKSEVTGELNLSGKSLTVETCGILGRLLSCSKTVRKLDFSDCLLPPQGLVAVLIGLANCVSVVHVNLKGNNVNLQTSIQLGRALAHNRSIKTMLLEWNSIGLSTDSLAQLCDGLGQNSSLETLDLRNNQFGAEAGTYLATALATNSTLRALDLRWNKLGHGAQHLLRAMERNKTLTMLKLQGNAVPAKIVAALDQCVVHNCQVLKLESEYSARTDLLERHIKTVEEERSAQIKCLTERTVRQIRETESRLVQLEKGLAERSAQLSELQLQLTDTQGELRRTEEQRCVLEGRLAEGERRHSELVAANEAALLQVDKARAAREAEHAAAREEWEGRLGAERTERDRLEAELTNERAAVESGKEALVRLRREMDKAACQHRDTLEANQKACLDRCQQSALEVTKVEAQAARLQSCLEMAHRAESEARTQLANEQANCSQRIATLIAEANEKESCRVLVLSERVESQREERASLIQQLESAQADIAQLKRDNANLVADIAEPTRKLSVLHEELSAERLLTQRLRGELVDAGRIVEAVRAEAERLRGEAEGVRARLANYEVDAIRQRKDAAAQLDAVNAKLNSKQKEVDSLRVEEMERAGLLCAAFNKYLGGSIRSQNPDTIL